MKTKTYIPTRVGLGKLLGFHSAGWLVAELCIITMLSWFFIDNLVVYYYDRYLTGDITPFETHHLVVGRMEVDRTDAGQDQNRDVEVTQDADQAALDDIRNRLLALPEVESVCYADDYVFAQLDRYHWTTWADAYNTKEHRAGAYSIHLYLDEPFFETHGIEVMRAKQSAQSSPSSPSAQSAPSAQSSPSSPDDEDITSNAGQVYISRCMARSIFGSEEAALGKKLVWLDVDYADRPDGSAPAAEEVRGTYTVAGVTADVKASPEERNSLVVFVQEMLHPMLTSHILIRLKPDADAKDFVKRTSKNLYDNFNSGRSFIQELETYDQHISNQSSRTSLQIENQLFLLILAIFGVNALLGVVGTFWMQLRRRREEIGIMRSFGATRWRILRKMFGEGVLLYTVSFILADIIYLQIVLSTGMVSDRNMGQLIGEASWIEQFWPHFAIVSAVVYLLILLLVCIGVLIPTLHAIRVIIVDALHED
ncbi:MAG: FtsX-like permease family protein [Bacteroidaceae bacterium]|nr:FtsX-like permease family protein [Bacteroidaceae bacterium]